MYWPKAGLRRHCWCRAHPFSGYDRNSGCCYVASHFLTLSERTFLTLSRRVWKPTLVWVKGVAWVVLDFTKQLWCSFHHVNIVFIAIWFPYASGVIVGVSFKYFVFVYTRVLKKRLLPLRVYIKPI